LPALPCHAHADSEKVPAGFSQQEGPRGHAAENIGRPPPAKPWRAPPVIEPEDQEQDGKHGLDEKREDNDAEGVDVHRGPVSLFGASPGGASCAVVSRYFQVIVYEDSKKFRYADARHVPFARP
jgi:hypothetical protein